MPANVSIFPPMEVTAGPVESNVRLENDVPLGPVSWTVRRGCMIVDKPARTFRVTSSIVANVVTPAHRERSVPVLRVQIYVG